MSKVSFSTLSRFTQTILDKTRYYCINAPEAVVNNERKKLADGEARIKILNEEIEQLKNM